jgi:hypothetical protein
VDPKIIPTFGIYISYDRKIPEKQKLPSALFVFTNNNDWFASEISDKPVKLVPGNDASENFASTEFIEEVNYTNEKTGDNDAELIKKYFHNPIGILPYFPPDK